MEPTKRRKTGNLRRGRVSIPGASYFITVCTKERHLGLHKSQVALELLEQFRELHRSKNLNMLGATVMQDHLHCLFELGWNLTLSQVLKKFNSQTGKLMKNYSLL